MRIIGLTDVHGSLSSIKRMNNVICRVDLVLFVGDITNFGKKPEAAQVVAPVVHSAKKTFAVSGNCDYPEVDAYLDGQGVNLHRRGEMIDGIWFVGLGGSLPTPFQTITTYSETEMAEFLDHGLAQLSNKTDTPIVLVSHQPPFQTLCDRISTGTHVGSHAVRRFIEAHRPLVCFTGHIHESVAIDKIGDTHIVNSGLLKNGHYAYAEIRGLGVETLEIRSV